MLKENLQAILQQIPPHVTLVAVSKTKPANAIEQLYQTGHRVFGENKVQELCEKYTILPKDIQWHLIGHLQRNKVKYIAPFVSLIHAVDSLKLLQEINKEAKKNNRVISCLLQIKIAEEDSKFGLSKTNAKEILNQYASTLSNVNIVGLMGMATFTNDENQLKNEFSFLKSLFDLWKDEHNFTTLSMGMSGDYQLAINEGSNMVRVGSAIFGERNY